MKKKLTILFFAVLLSSSLWLANQVLSIKSGFGVKQAREMYIQPENTIDVVMMGSSHIHCNIDTALLWRTYGIAAYDYSGAEQTIWENYYYLQEFCKYQQPKLVVLDVFMPARFRNDYHLNWYIDNVLGMRFSLTKLKMMVVSCERGRILDYFPAFMAYHNRYGELTDEDFSYLTRSVYDRQSFKGFTPCFNVEPQPYPVIENPDAAGGMTEKSRLYLQKIIDYTKEKGISLLLIATPYVTMDEDYKGFNDIARKAKENGILFDNANLKYEELGLDFGTDFNDYSHLNYLGEGKYTLYLGGLIKNCFDVPDRRGDERYESWDRHVAEIDELVARTVEEMQKKHGGQE